MRWIMVMLVVALVGTAALAETVQPATPAQPAPQAQVPAGAVQPPVPAQPSPVAQPLSPQELQALQHSADSLAATGQVQNMQVGAGVNGTIVLSVLVALIIFAVLVSVL